MSSHQHMLMNKPRVCIDVHLSSVFAEARAHVKKPAPSLGFLLHPGSSVCKDATSAHPAKRRRLDIPNHLQPPCAPLHHDQGSIQLARPPSRTLPTSLPPPSRNPCPPLRPDTPQVPSRTSPTPSGTASGTARRPASRNVRTGHGQAPQLAVDQGQNSQPLSISLQAAIAGPDHSRSRGQKSGEPRGILHSRAASQLLGKASTAASHAASRSQGKASPAAATVADVSLKKAGAAAASKAANQPLSKASPAAAVSAGEGLGRAGVASALKAPHQPLSKARPAASAQAASQSANKAGPTAAAQAAGQSGSKACPAAAQAASQSDSKAGPAATAQAARQAVSKASPAAAQAAAHSVSKAGPTTAGQAASKACPTAIAQAPDLSVGKPTPSAASNGMSALPKQTQITTALPAHGSASLNLATPSAALSSARAAVNRESSRSRQKGSQRSSRPKSRLSSSSSQPARGDAVSDPNGLHKDSTTQPSSLDHQSNGSSMGPGLGLSSSHAQPGKQSQDGMRTKASPVKPRVEQQTHRIGPNPAADPSPCAKQNMDPRTSSDVGPAQNQTQLVGKSTCPDVRASGSGGVVRTVGSQPGGRKATSSTKLPHDAHRNGQSPVEPQADAAEQPPAAQRSSTPDSVIVLDHDSDEATAPPGTRSV